MLVTSLYGSDIIVLVILSLVMSSYHRKLAILVTPSYITDVIVCCWRHRREILGVIGERRHIIRVSDVNSDISGGLVTPLGTS